jgi:hypothetical protein
MCTHSSGDRSLGKRMIQGKSLTKITYMQFNFSFITQTINVYIGLRMLLAINPCGMETKISALDCLINCIFFHTLSKSYETYL